MNEKKRGRFLGSGVRFILAFVLIVSVQSSFACKYTVRDIGYSTISEQRWTLLSFVQKESIPNATLKRWMEEANTGHLQIGIQNIPEDYKSFYSVQKGIPQYVLIQQNGEEIFSLPMDRPLDFFTASWQNELTNLLANHFAVVCVFKKGEDTRFENLVNQKIASFKDSMVLLPKQDKQVPTTVVFDLDNRSQKNQELISMLQPLSNQSSAVVLYGRGRKMGEALSLKQITSKSLDRMLTLIGADCECGLSRQSLLGNLLPFCWSEELLQQTSKRINVDLLHPLTQVEMKQIVSKEIYRADDKQQLTHVPRESSIARSQNKRELPIIVDDTPTRQNYQIESTSDYTLWYWIVGIVSVFLLIGVFLILRKTEE